MIHSATPVDPAWLALRGPADDRARSATGGALADELARWLQRRQRDMPARLVDVGAGTGAGALWLRRRMRLPQQWRLLDHDPDLLALAQPVRLGWAEPVVADLAQLPRLLAQDPADALTCQALLDLLTADACRALIDAAIPCHAAVLAGLTVTGEVRLSPAHGDDAAVLAAFNSHQQRAGRLGPTAGSFTARTLRSHGYTLLSARTPWRLGPPEEELLSAWLAGYAQAAAEQVRADQGPIARWLAARLQDARRGRLVVSVGHVDLLGLPPTPEQ